MSPGFTRCKRWGPPRVTPLQGWAAGCPCDCPGVPLRTPMCRIRLRVTKDRHFGTRALAERASALLRKDESSSVPGGNETRPRRTRMPRALPSGGEPWSPGHGGVLPTPVARATRPRSAPPGRGEALGGEAVPGRVGAQAGSASSRRRVSPSRTENALAKLSIAPSGTSTRSKWNQAPWVRSRVTSTTR